MAKRIPLDVEPEKYTQIKNHADNKGESVNSYIRKAIDRRMHMETLPEEKVREEELIEKYGPERVHKEDYANCTRDGLEVLCAMKDRTNDMFIQRTDNARRVIDAITEKLGMNPVEEGTMIYYDESILVKKIDEELSKNTDYAKMRAKIEELENDNKVLRKMIGGDSK